MDFTNNNQQPSAPSRPAYQSTAPDSPAPAKRPHKSISGGKNSQVWMRWGGGALVVIVAILIGAALGLFFTYNPTSEGHYVQTNKLQAVFLTNNQVYFGNITAINNKYLTLDNIYYLQSQSTDNNATNTNVSLIKLGCELHKPYDQMVINQDQVSFWENLQSDGQVAKAVQQYQSANPNGQTCSNTTQNSANGSSVQGTPTNTNNSTSNSSNSTSTSNSTSNSTSKP